MNHSSTILTTENLTIGYPSKKQQPKIIATNINLSLNSGKLVCLLGSNGAGKSTLLRTLAGMQAPIEGKVNLLGKNLKNINPQELAKQLSLVLTDKIEADLMSVSELLSLGRYPYTNWWGKLTTEDEIVINWAINATGITPLVNRKIQELSDGEKQKVMIARALAQEPILMILDEPTAYLDLPRRIEMMQLLRNLARNTNKAILLSTHDLDLALRCADLIWLLSSEGKLTVGIPEELVLNGTLAANFNTNNVQFNPNTGTFCFQKPNAGKINLTGEGIAKIWTTHALQRLGFEVIDNNNITNNNPKQIKILKQKNQLIWLYYNHDYVSKHTSLAQVIESLQS